MTQYTVRWEIEVDADAALEAAWKAKIIQADPASTANVFEVIRYWNAPNRLRTSSRHCIVIDLDRREVR